MTRIKCLNCGRNENVPDWEDLDNYRCYCGSNNWTINGRSTKPGKNM